MEINNILLIGTIPPPNGGDAIWMQTYMDFLQQKGINYSFVDTSLIGNRAINVGAKKSIFEEIKRARQIRKNLQKNLSSFSFTLVHMNINCSPFGTIRDYFNVKLLKRKKKKIVIHCHCNVEDQIGKRKISLYFLKKILNMGDAIFVLNTSSKDFVQALSKRKVYIMPNFISQSSIKNFKQINTSIRTAVFVGHIKREKGIIEYLETSKLFNDIKFRIVGKCTDTFNIKEFEKYPNVCYLGDVKHEQIFEIFDESDIFIFPSYTEGFSIALLEGMARGMPIIASDVGANKDMLCNNCGIILEKNTSIEIANSIIKMQNLKERKNFSLNAINKVKRLYETNTVCNSMLEIYKTIL